MNSERTRLGLKAAQDGDRREARRIFAAIVREEPDDAMAWWHLANFTDDSEQKAQCLKQVLRIMPEHHEARRMLTEVQKQVVRQTPAGGLRRPVADADATGEVSRPSLDRLPPVPALPRQDLRLPVGIAVVVGLLVITVIAVVNGLPDAPPPVPTPTPTPPRGLALTVEQCLTTSSGKSTLTFVNQSGHVLTLFKGGVGQEASLGTLPVGAQQLIETAPGEQVRYSARADDNQSLNGGATIEVPAGNSCTVPIK